MENPHEARQAVLLERIGKNVEKCLEAVQELNVCLNVSRGWMLLSFFSFLRGVSQRGSGRGGFFGEYWAWVPVRDVV
jgi:hypothetical protein